MSKLARIMGSISVMPVKQEALDILKEFFKKNFFLTNCNFKNINSLLYNFKFLI